MEHNVLFRTIHGSRLYGLSHDASDYDWYTVIDKPVAGRAKYSTHEIVDNQDSVVVDFGTWIKLCTLGVPQALEAMFSKQAEVDKIEDFRLGFRASDKAVVTHMRTIRNIYEGKDADSFKHKRHMLRLGMNVKALRHARRFEPTLTPAKAALISRVAELEAEHVFEVAKSLAWS